MHQSKEKSAFPKLNNSIILLIVLLSVFFTFVTSFVYYLRFEKQEKVRFDYETALLIARIQNRMDHYESALIQVRSFFTVDGNVTQKEFREYFEVTQLPVRYQGFDALGFAEKVLATSGEVTFPVKMIEPYNINNKAIDFDFFSNQILKTAMTKAAECNCAIISGKVDLLQSDEKIHAGFLLFLPVFSQDKELKGFIFAPFRTDELFGYVTKLRPTNFNFVIYESILPRSESLLYSYKPNKGNVILNRNKIFQFAGRDYTLNIQMFADKNHRESFFVLIGIALVGLVLTAILFWLLQFFKRELKLSNEITQSRNQLQQTQKDLELRSEAIENSLNGFDIIDENGKFIYVNKSYLKMWGYDTAEEVLGTSPASHCLDPEIPYKIISLLKQDGKCDIEFKAKRKDGSLFDVRMLAFIAHDHEGREIYPTTSIDITATKRAEDKVRSSEEQLTLITNSIPSFISYIDKDLHYRFVNDAYSLWFKLPLEEIVGHSIYKVHGELMESSPYIARTLKGEETSFTTKLISDEGKVKYVRISYIPNPDEHGNVKGFVALGFDITEIQQALLDRDQFLSIASHELKTPLSSLLLQSQIMARMIDKGDESAFSPDKVKKMINTVTTQVGRLNRLVEDMLDVSRIRTGKFSIKNEDFDICDLVKEVLDQMKGSFESHSIPLPEFKSCDSARGRWDKLRIGQVMMNLLTNAMRYGEGKQILVEVQDLGDEILFSVVDQGMGIAEKDKSKIFDAFERAISSNEVSGLGLGLYISHQIVSAHKGRIDVESEVGKGSTFKVYLPKFAI